MTADDSNPPRLALWWLRHMCPGEHNEAITGDLFEKFREGETRSWFWRQVLITFSVCALGELRDRWPFFCYAVTGSIAIYLTPRYAQARILSWLHWSDLPWPLSQFVLELSTPFIVTLITLCILASGLVIERSFRWAFLFRAWIINFALVMFGHYAIKLFPWLLRPAPGDPYHRILILPGILEMLLLASTFLIVVWVRRSRMQRSEDSQ